MGIHTTMQSNFSNTREEDNQGCAVAETRTENLSVSQTWVTWEDNQGFRPESVNYAVYGTFGCKSHAIPKIKTGDKHKSAVEVFEYKSG